MSYLPVLILALLAIVNLFVFAFFLWTACKIPGVRRTGAASEDPPMVGIRFRRALGTVAVLSMGGILLSLAWWWLTPRQSEIEPWLSIIPLALHFVLILAVLRWLVCPTLGRMLLVTLLFEGFVLAYTLAFVFAVHSTFVHPYIMPTGSMAETLNGYHKDVTCPTCGCDFAINCSAEADPVEGRRSSITYACICPNCRQAIHFPSAPASHSQEYPHSISLADPGIQGGDRFFTGRGLLGPEAIPPRRFDLFAHEFRSRGRTVEYVKRIMGMPGETVALRGGDVYVLAADKGLAYDDAEAMRKVNDTPEGREFTHANDPEALERFKKGRFEILRKSPEQILALRHLVYDDTHRAKEQPARWRNDDGWKTDGNRFHSAAGEGVAWLRYRHLLPDNHDKPALLTDLSGYNTYQNLFHRPLLGNNWVGDLLLECQVVLDKPQGELTLELSRGVDRFRARWDLSNGVCTLLRVADGDEQPLENKPTRLKTKGSYRLRFANVDERLVVWVNDELPFGEGVSHSPPKQAGPTEKNDLQPAGIGVRGGEVEIGAIRLFRDVYYTMGENPSAPDVADFSPTDPETWNELRQPPIRTFYVQPGHYFMLGDNSPESSDSRFWGSIPHRHLLGKALFVYYPWKRIGPLR
jgi:signal peptidase I